MKMSKLILRVLLVLIVSVECKHFIKEPRFTLMKNKQEPGEDFEGTEYGDGTMDYSYMTKDRNSQPQTQNVEEKNEEETPNEPVKEEQKNVNSASNNAQSGTFGPNSGNMSNNTNSNNTTTTNNNYQNPEKSLKDDMPLSSLKVPSNTNVHNRTDASHHKGDTSTFVTNNFFNPSNKNNDSIITVGGELEFEYLWKRIYDIDNKLSELNPISKKSEKNLIGKKGLIITFDPESDPNNKSLSVESEGNLNYL